MADYIWNSSYLVVSLQSESSYIYIYALHKTLCVLGKNLCDQREGSTNGRLGRTKQRKIRM